MGRFASFVLHDMKRNLGRLSVASVGIVIGIWAAVTFVALGIGVDSFLEGKVFPWDTIVVVPASTQLQRCPDDDYYDDTKPFGTLVPDAPRHKKYTAITDEVVKLIKARPEVREAYPKMKASFPASLVGGRNLLNLPYDLKTELFIDGIPEDEIVQCDASDTSPGCEVTKPYEFKDYGPEDSKLPKCFSDSQCPKGTFCAVDEPRKPGRCYHPIPAVVSPYLLEIWNTSVAPAHGYPRIDRASLGNFLGATARVYLGESVFSTIRQKGGPMMRRFRLVGVSDKALSLGVTVPMGYVKRWNSRFSSTSASYSSLVVRVKDKRSVQALLSYVKSLGLGYEESKAETAGLAVMIVTSILLFISLVIVLLAAINIGQTFYTIVAERRREIGVLRAIGASRRHITALFVLQGTILGVTAASVGVFLAVLTGLLGDWAFVNMVPEFPFKPDTVFVFPWWLWLGALVFGVVASVFAAYLPARAASRVEPSEALSIMV